MVLPHSYNTMANSYIHCHVSNHVYFLKLILPVQNILNNRITNNKLTKYISIWNIFQLILTKSKGIER